MTHFKRVLLTGQSGSGKTYCLPYIFSILKPIPEEILIFTNTPHQKIYEIAVNRIFGKNMPLTIYDEMPTINFLKDDENRETLMKRKHTLVIFDDVDKKTMTHNICPFFTMSRHFNMSVILIYQRFYDIPLTIRINTNFICVFRCSFSYDTLYQTIKRYFKNDKKAFDSTMALLDEPKYRFYFLEIDMDKMGKDMVKMKKSDFLK